jgi:hypothetical protein
MGALEQFESFLQDLLERPAWMMSPRRLQPLEVASALTRELEARVQRVGGRLLVPNDYLVLVSEEDLARLHHALGELEREMTEYVQRLASERAITLQSPPSVRIRAGPDVHAGQIFVHGEFGSARRVAVSPAKQALPGGPVGASLALLAEDDSEVGQIPLQERSMTLGRRSDNDIPVADTKISRHHARLEFEAGGYYLTDLGSTNGTRVNGREIGGRCALEPEDVIEVGLQRFRFRG